MSTATAITEPVGIAEFFQRYLETALDERDEDREDDKPLSYTYDLGDIHPEALAEMRAECVKFLSENGELIEEDNLIVVCSSSALERAAYHFWQTRNGSGTGFWDGDWKEDVGEKLTAAAHAFNPCSLYAGDDERLHYFAG